jgi:hypothetical protein
LAEYYFTTTYSIKGLKKQRNWVTSKPDRFTKQMLFKCRDTNLFATGNAARNYNLKWNLAVIVAAALVENFKYKAQHLLILLKSK